MKVKIELNEYHIDWTGGNHKATRVDIYDVAALAQTLLEKESIHTEQIAAGTFILFCGLNHMFINH